MEKCVAVLILNWNGAKLLPEFLPSVIANTPADIADVIVADNGSTDQSLQILAEQFPTVITLSFSENKGFAGGYNAAVAASEYPYICLLNSDVEVSPNWLPPLLTHLELNPDCAAVMPKIKSYRHKSCFEYAGAAGGFMDPLAYPYCRGRIFDTVELDHQQYDKPMEVFWTTGAAMLIRRDDFMDLAGFDEAFFAHQEEIDLCWRLQLKGKTLSCEPTSEVYHLGGASLSKENPRKTFLNFRNNLLMLYKNIPRERRSFVLFLRGILDALAAVIFLLGGKGKDAKAVLNAWKAFRKMRCEDSMFSEEQRKRVYERLLSSKTPSLLLSYHIRRKKYFSQL